MTRATLYVLLPISVVAALILAWQGVPQTFGRHRVTRWKARQQTIALGPVASQEAIKLLSGDGGGFFNANSAHPFENPTALTNLVEMLLILLIGAALTNTFGRMVGDERQGWALLAAMLVLLLVGAWRFTPRRARQSGRGTRASTSTAAAAISKARRCALACPVGAVRHWPPLRRPARSTRCIDSFMPSGRLVLLGNMMLDEVIIGGPGSGLYGMLLFAIVAVFMAGLMIGRTPEYVGNKIEAPKSN